MHTISYNFYLLFRYIIGSCKLIMKKFHSFHCL